MPILVILLWISAAWLTFGALSLPAVVGKERKPMTPGIAIVTLISSVVIVGALVWAALVIGGLS